MKMKKRKIAVICALCIFVIVLITAEPKPVKEPYYNPDLLAIRSMDTNSNDSTYFPEFYYDDVDMLPYTYSKHVETLEDFYEWKKGPVLAQFENLLTYDEASIDGVELITTEQKGNYTLNRYTMPAYDHELEKIIFYEAIPETKNNKTVFLIPGSGNTGVRDVLNLPSNIEHRYYQNHMFDKIVNEGYVVYTVELRGYGERVIDIGDACKNKSLYEQILACQATLFSNSLKFIGKDMNLIQTEELTQVIKYIDSKDYDKIGVVGLSLGGDLSQNMAILHPDIVDAVVIASSGGSALRAPINFNIDGKSQFLCCDTNDKTATIAPMPMYKSYGIKETGTFGWEANTNYTGNFLKEVYSLHEAEDKFYYYVGEGVHEYYHDSVLEFLKNEL